MYKLRNFSILFCTIILGGCVNGVPIGAGPNALFLKTPIQQNQTTVKSHEKTAQLILEDEVPLDERVVKARKILHENYGDMKALHFTIGWKQLSQHKVVRSVIQEVIFELGGTSAKRADISYGSYSLEFNFDNVDSVRNEDSTTEVYNLYLESSGQVIVSHTAKVTCSGKNRNFHKQCILDHKTIREIIYRMLGKLSS